MRQPRIQRVNSASSNAKIFDLVKAHRYRELVERCISYPEQARKKQCRSEWFPKAYHRASVKRCAPGEEPFVEYNDTPRTVLHAVCGYEDIPVNVVDALLGAWPKAASTGMKDTGRIPLHVASCVVSDPRVLQTLLKADASSFYMRDCFDRTPLAHLCNFYSVTLFHVLESINTTGNVTLNRSLAAVTSDCRKQKKNSHPIFRFWANATILVKEASRDLLLREMNMNSCFSKKPSSGFYMVHGCLSLGSSCPEPLLDLAMNVHLDQLSKADETDDGNLPLHVVCKRGDLQLLQKVLRAFPEAAKRANKDGKLPLHLLATRLANSPAHFDGEVIGYVDTLIKANPGALSLRDGKSELMPFMAAAADNHFDDGMQVDEREVFSDQLNVIFHLLRSNPSSLCR